MTNLHVKGQKVSDPDFCIKTLNYFALKMSELSCALSGVSAIALSIGILLILKFGEGTF